MLFQIFLLRVCLGTLDVREVSVFKRPGAFCASCKYVLNSPAQGCILVASRTGVDRDIEYSNNISMSEEEGCLSLTILGRYRVRVFDWQPNGERSDKSAYDEFMDLTEGTAREFSLAV